MAEVLLWTGGSLKQPGALVRPTNTGAVSQTPIDNGDFAAGDVDWTESGSGSFDIDNTGPVFNSPNAGRAFVADGNILTVNNDAVLDCVPGQIVVARCYIYGPTQSGNVSRAQFQILWYNDAMAPLAPSKLALDPTPVFGGGPRIDGDGLIQYAARDIWLPLEVEGIAPPGAVFFTVGFIFRGGTMTFYVDQVSIDYANVEPENTLLFRAVQANAGFTGNVEPVWPDTIGVQVVDNEVTWEAVSGTSVTWQAQRILVSGATEPTGTNDWPLAVGGSVVDNTIVWVLDSRQVNDTHVPTDSEIVLLAASKVYAADQDIIPYSATVNPLDWSTPEDAGYIPFGLNVYGSNPISAMGLYRGNIAAFNSQGCQIWQVDPDPSAITILDALPIPCTYPKSLAPVGDDLALLTNLGIRSLGVAGSEVNLAGGYFGKQVDPLVVAAIAEALEEGWTPRGLYWPAHGQYMLFFGAQAFVLTINGPSKEQRSWSRYTLPSVVDAWTILGTDLYLRSGELVWRFDAEALCDDEHDETSEVQSDLNTATLYEGDGWLAGATDIDLDEVHNYAVGTPVQLFGPSLTGLFADTTVVTGAIDATSIVVSDPVTASAGDMVLLRYPTSGTYEAIDGNEVDSETLTLDVGLPAGYVAAGTVLRITWASGVDWNYIRRDVEVDDTEIELELPLEHVAEEIRVFPAGAAYPNEVNADIMYVGIELAAPAAATTTLSLERGLPAAATGLQFIVCEYQLTTVAGGAGTAAVDLADAAAFDNGGVVREDFTFATGGPWQVPAGVTSIDILCVGAGGNGPSDGIVLAGGGGGGGVTETLGVVVTPLEMLTVDVSSSAGLPDNAGGPSLVSRGITPLAQAGGGGAANGGLSGENGTAASGNGGGGYSDGTPQPAGLGAAPDGNDGGAAVAGAGGGGGGAGGVGSAGVGTTAGNGGPGADMSSWGTDIGDNGFFGGGGAGLAGTGGTSGTTGVNSGTGFSYQLAWDTTQQAGFVAIRYGVQSTDPEAGFPGSAVFIGEFADFGVCTPFESVMQWPFLDMATLAQDKELIGFDLSIDGECTVSFGWDQRFTEYDVDSWTTPYAVDGDTMPGTETLPFSITSNSFAMRLVFPGEQQWMWYSASMTIKDLTQ